LKRQFFSKVIGGYLTLSYQVMVLWQILRVLLIITNGSATFRGN